jgi:hypothetical protein
LSSYRHDIEDAGTGCAWECLLLQVESEKAGYATTSPPAIKGKSGVTHRFSYLCSSDETKVAFDIYKNLSEVEVMTTYIKMFDTGAHCFIVNLGEAPDGPTTRLLAAYRIPVLAGVGVETATPFPIETMGRSEPRTEVAEVL